jgi:hypothetical protein
MKANAKPIEVLARILSFAKTPYARNGRSTRHIS